MKKVFYIISIFLYLFIGISMVNADSGPIISGEKEVLVGNSITLTASFSNGCLGRAELDKVCTEEVVDVTDKVDWSVNNDNITVNKGTVTGVKEGVSTITATYTHTDGLKVSSIYEIKVVSNTNNGNTTNNDNLNVLVVFSSKGQTDEISNDTWTLNKNDTLNLETKLCNINDIDNNNNYDKTKCQNVNVTYNANNNVIKVNNSGNLKALKTGSTILTIQNNDKKVNIKIKVEGLSLFKLPDTASKSSILAVTLSILFLIAASVFYVQKINKLKVWEDE